MPPKADYRIWKYPVPIQSEFELQLPTGLRVLHVGVEQHDPDGDDQLCLWILHDIRQPKMSVKFAIIGTGHPIVDDPDELWHIGTVQAPPFVWHIFMRARPLQETRRPL